MLIYFKIELLVPRSSTIAQQNHVILWISFFLHSETVQLPLSSTTIHGYTLQVVSLILDYKATTDVGNKNDDDYWPPTHLQTGINRGSRRVVASRGSGTFFFSLLFSLTIIVYGHYALAQPPMPTAN